MDDGHPVLREVAQILNLRPPKASEEIVRKQLQQSLKDAEKTHLEARAELDKEIIPLATKLKVNLYVDAMVKLILARRAIELAGFPPEAA